MRYTEGKAESSGSFIFNAATTKWIYSNNKIMAKFRFTEFISYSKASKYFENIWKVNLKYRVNILYNYVKYALF